MTVDKVLTWGYTFVQGPTPGQRHQPQKPVHSEKTASSIRGEFDAMGAAGCLERLAGTYLLAPPLQPMPAWPAFEEMGRIPLAALAAPGGFLALGKVAAVVQERYAEVIWIRLGMTDADPGALLATLLGAAARSGAEVRAAGVAEVAARHARLGEWRQAYQLSARWLAAVTARPAVVVLEGAEHMRTGNSPSLDLLVSAFVTSLPDNLDVLLIGFTKWHRRRLDPHGQVLGPAQLRLDRRAAARLAETSLLDVPSATIRRSFTLTRGAAGALQAAFSAGAVLGPRAFHTVVAAAASGEELLSALCRHLLAHADQSTLIALAGAARLGIWHRDMTTALGYSATEPSEPWWLDLGQCWQQLNPVWRAPLHSAGGTVALDPASLALLADHLARQGAGDRAFDLYIEAGEVDRAADMAVGIARDLAGTGCWATLARMGQALARSSPAGRPGLEPGHTTDRPVRWWPRRPGRRGRRSRGRVRGAFDVRPLDVHAKAGMTAPAVRSAAPAVRQAHRAEPVSQIGAMPATMPGTAPDVTVHLLGELRVAFHDRPVQAWASGRARAVFEYLLVHRHSKVRRDRLMSVFWPDASSDAARNSLNVAIHRLRQSLRPVAGDAAVVIHQDCAYFIEPTLQVWLDVEAFEERLKSAHQHLASVELAKAQAAFEAAIWLYQGEFLADDPYEEWAVLSREHLRLCYLDSLDRLSMLRLNSGDYTGCVEVCLKLLASDSCREDAHCRLMRCYSRQGQTQLALRQYHACAVNLRRELGVAPAAATTELFHRIRRREAI